MSENAILIGEAIGLIPILLVALYAIFFHSRKRYPHLTWSQRAYNMFTFKREW